MMRTTLVALTCCCLATPLPCPGPDSKPDTVDDLPPLLVARLKLAKHALTTRTISRLRWSSTDGPGRIGQGAGLFNVGRRSARASIGPVEAVAEFDKLLAAPGRTPEPRLEEARRLRDEQRARHRASG